MKKNIEEKKEEIQGLGLNKIKDYLKLPIKQLKRADREILKHLYNMARIGMQFEKEMNVSKRAIENNHIKVGRFITENKEELKEYFKATLPKYCP